MSRRRAGVVVCALSICLSACSRTPERVVLGIASTSRTHLAVQLAIDEINAAGGVRGVRLEPMGLDWRPEIADSGAVIKWADRFADEPELLGVVGPSSSVAALTSAAIYNRRQVPQLVTIATNPAITDVGPWTYRLCVSDAHQGPALARYAVREWGRRRMALFYVNDAYGKGLAREFRQEVERLGAEVVESAFHGDQVNGEDKAHIDRILRRLSLLPQERAPDLFVLIQRTQAGIWTTSEIRELGFEVPILGADNLSLSAFVRAYPETVEGLRASAFYVPSDGGGRGRAFREAVRERTGLEADYEDSYAYDAVYLLRDAVAGGGFSRAGVKEYLDGLIVGQRAVDGVAGSFTLGPDHDARRNIYIVELRGGVATPVFTIPPN
jgi:branched-chain amino acid transport system substrate-binding protein